MELKHAEDLCRVLWLDAQVVVGDEELPAVPAATALQQRQ
jgi:hypothetical protein